MRKENHRVRVVPHPAPVRSQAREKLISDPLDLIRGQRDKERRAFELLAIVTAIAGVAAQRGTTTRDQLLLWASGGEG